MNRNNFGNFGNFNNSNFSQRPVSPFDGIKRFFTGKSMLSRLILINIAVFVLVNLVKLYLFLFQIPVEGILHYLYIGQLFQRT